MTHPHIPPATLHRIVEPWSDPRSYAPDPVEMLRANARISPSIFATLAADAREAFDDPFFTFFVGGVLGSLLVCVLAFFWTVVVS